VQNRSIISKRWPPSDDLVFPHTVRSVVRSVAPYIHAHRGKTFVVAIAGELIAAGQAREPSRRTWR
jgi:hypothetical protein